MYSLIPGTAYLLVGWSGAAVSFLCLLFYFFTPGRKDIRGHKQKQKINEGLDWLCVDPILSVVHSTSESPDFMALYKLVFNFNFNT